MPATGCAAPMFVPGAMAATSATIVMRKPADAARAPEGPTNTATGVLQLSILAMSCRIEVSRPPGVSMRMMTSGAPSASARSMACTTWPALTACTTPSSSTTGISAAARAAAGDTTSAQTTRVRTPRNMPKCKGLKGFLSIQAARESLVITSRSGPSWPPLIWSREIMFGSLGGPELFLILVVALIVFGPRKLPEIGKSLGRMMAEFRKASNDFRRTIEEEVEADKLREATKIDLSPVASTAAAAPATTAEPEVTPADASTPAEPAPPPGAEPAASDATTTHPETEAASSSIPAHEPALTVSREPVAAPQPVEQK